MKKALVILSVLLLLFNGVGAFYGGWSLISDPTGADLGLDINYLKDSPFETYLIPGWVLITMNGLLSVSAAVSVFLRKWYYPHWIFLQGIILLGWLGAQIIMIDFVYFLHYVMGATGVMLILCGAILIRFSRTKSV